MAGRDLDVLAEQRLDQRDLLDRGDVESPNSCPMQCAQDLRVRIALDRVQHLARKRGGEALRQSTELCKPHAEHGFVRPYCGDDVLNRSVMGKAADRACLLWRFFPPTTAQERPRRNQLARSFGATDNSRPGQQRPIASAWAA